MDNMNDHSRQPNEPEMEIASESDTVPPQAEFEKLREEAATWKDNYLRLYADLDNTKRRLKQQSLFEVEQEKKKLLNDFLPVIDNLERALKHATGDPVEQGLRHGVELTYKMLLNAFAQNGVTPINAWHQPFDPEIHEALGFVKQDKLPPGTVAHVEETGYMLDGRLLRSAKVLITPG